MGIEYNTPRRNTFWLICQKPVGSITITYTMNRATLYELHEETQQIAWLKDYIFSLIEEGNPILDFMPSNQPVIRFDLLNKPLCQVTNKDLFECGMPDAVGSFLLDFIENKMGYKWVDVKESMVLGEVFVQYKKLVKVL